jgi:hypothetical protein
MLISGLTNASIQSLTQSAVLSDGNDALAFKRQHAAALAKAQAEKSTISAAQTASSNAQSATTADQTATKQTESAQPTTKQNENFMNQIMEQLIAKRLGLDKKKLDELKLEMEKLLQQRAELADQAGADPKAAQQLSKIDDKISAISKMMEQLIAQDLERRTKQEQEKQQVDSVKTALQKMYPLAG